MAAQQPKQAIGFFDRPLPETLATRLFTRAPSNAVNAIFCMESCGDGGPCKRHRGAVLSGHTARLGELATPPIRQDSLPPRPLSPNEPEPPLPSPAAALDRCSAAGCPRSELEGELECCDSCLAAQPIDMADSVPAYCDQHSRGRLRECSGTCGGTVCAGCTHRRCPTCLGWWCRDCAEGLQREQQQQQPTVNAGSGCPGCRRMPVFVVQLPHHIWVEPYAVKRRWLVLQVHRHLLRRALAAKAAEAASSLAALHGSLPPLP